MRRGREFAGHILLSEGAVQQPSHDWEVAVLIVGWEDDGVFVLRDRRHVGRLMKECAN
jgi:hypothetical protein